MLYNAPIKKLKQPYQRGWVRFFALRDDVLRRNDADRFRELLEYVQCIHYSRKRHFLVRLHAKSSRFRQRKHKLRVFTALDALQLKIPEQLLSYFMTQKRRPIATRARLRELMLSGYRGPIKIRHPHYFVRKIEPYMITHSRVALPDIERRLSEVEFILDQAPNRGRLKNLQCSHSYIWEQIQKEQETRKFSKTTIQDIELALQEYYMEQKSITQERVLFPLSLFLFRVGNHTFCRHSGTAT